MMMSLPYSYAVMFLPISHMPPSGIMRRVARLGCSLARERIVGGFLPTHCSVCEMQGFSSCMIGDDDAAASALTRAHGFRRTIGCRLLRARRGVILAGRADAHARRVAARLNRILHGRRLLLRGRGGGYLLILRRRLDRTADVLASCGDADGYWRAVRGDSRFPSPRRFRERRTPPVCAACADGAAFRLYGCLIVPSCAGCCAVVWRGFLGARGDGLCAARSPSALAARDGAASGGGAARPGLPYGSDSEADSGFSDRKQAACSILCFRFLPQKFPFCNGAGISLRIFKQTLPFGASILLHFALLRACGGHPDGAIYLERSRRRRRAKIHNIFIIHEKLS